MTHHTKTKGDLGSLKIQCKLCEKGWLILNPNTEHAPFDFVAYKDKKFLKIQAKYREARKGKVEVRLSTVWADKHGNHSKPYDLSEVDVMAVYCPDNDEVYFFKPTSEMKSFTIRIEKSGNGQSAGINKGEDFLEIPA